MLNTIIDEIVEERHAEEKKLAKKTEIKELEQPEKDLNDFVNTLDSFCLSLQKFSSQLANHRASEEIEDEKPEESTENNELDDFEHARNLTRQKFLSRLPHHQASEEIEDEILEEPIEDKSESLELKSLRIESKTLDLDILRAELYLKLLSFKVDFVSLNMLEIEKACEKQETETIKNLIVILFFANSYNTPTKEMSNTISSKISEFIPSEDADELLIFMIKFMEDTSANKNTTPLSYQSYPSLQNISWDALNQIKKVHDFKHHMHLAIEKCLYYQAPQENEDDDGYEKKIEYELKTLEIKTNSLKLYYELLLFKKEFRDLEILKLKQAFKKQDTKKIKNLFAILIFTNSDTIYKLFQEILDNMRFLSKKNASELVIYFEELNKEILLIEKNIEPLSYPSLQIDNDVLLNQIKKLDDFEHDTRLSLQKCLSLQKSLDQLTKHQAPQEIFEQTPTNPYETITLDKEQFEEYANKVDQMQKAFIQQLHSNQVNSQNLVDPKFLLSETDLKQIKFIQQNPKLHQYYLMMQKCFNEGFMFANMVSHGEITIEEKSKILNYLEKSQEFLGDIPFASLIISQIKNATSQILKAKTIGKQANFSDLVPNSSQIEANLFAEKIARYLIIARESSTQPNEKISTCHEESLSLQNQNRLDKIKEYIKENAKEILAKFDKDISRGFFGNDFSTSQRMAILDFQKACEIIFEIGIPDEIKALPHGDSRSEKIIKQLVEGTLTLSTGISFDAIPPCATQDDLQINFIDEDEDIKKADCGDEDRDRDDEDEDFKKAYCGDEDRDRDDEDEDFKKAYCGDEDRDRDEDRDENEDFRKAYCGNEDRDKDEDTKKADCGNEDRDKDEDIKKAYCGDEDRDRDDEDEDFRKAYCGNQDQSQCSNDMKGKTKIIGNIDTHTGIETLGPILISSPPPIQLTEQNQVPQSAPIKPNHQTTFSSRATDTSPKNKCCIPVCSIS